MLLESQTKKGQPPNKWDIDKESIKLCASPYDSYSDNNKIEQDKNVHFMLTHA